MMVKKIVLIPRACSGKNTFSISGWKLGAYRKLQPTRSISASPCGGASSTAIPSASSASALPEDDEMERLPCLATFAPAAAHTRELAELTLKVVSPPPVPHMSTRSPSTFGSICTQFARIARVM